MTSFGREIGQKTREMKKCCPAPTEARILVTLDKDFGEIAIVHGAPHSGILRLVNISATQQAAICQRVLVLYGEDLTAGAIVTAEPGRLRIRPPDA